MDGGPNPNSAKLDMPSLTGLRFVAAIYIVLLHHWRTFLPSYSQAKYWSEFLSLGYIAVSFFFVLSGFILAKVYLRSTRHFDRSAFWQARIARIYPVYALSMLLSAPFALVKRDGHGTLYHAAKAIFLLFTNLALLQAWHPALSGNWNRPSWSVSVEAFFYLIFPLVGAWVIARHRRALLIAAGFWLLQIGSSLVCLHLLPDISSSEPRLEIFLFNPLLRLPEFMIGICCGVWSSRRAMRSLQRFMWAAVLVCLLSIPLLVRLPWLLISNGLLSPLFGAVIVGLSEAEGLAGWLLGNRVMVRLGQASFSLYLLHFPVFFWMVLLVSPGSLVDRITGSWPIHSDSPLFLSVYLFASLAVSLASYSFLETPARGIVKKWLSDRQTRTPPTQPEMPETVAV